jgi:quinol monooxygenase YgiN
MKKSTILAWAVLATGLFACQTKNETAPSAVPAPPPAVGAREVAVYKVKAEKMADFPKIHAAMAKEVEAMTGCLGYKSMRQSPDTSRTFVDICEWRSLAEAQAAQQKVHDSPPPAIQAFFEAVETDILFGNFEENNF